MGYDDEREFDDYEWEIEQGLVEDPWKKPVLIRMILKMNSDLNIGCRYGYVCYE